MATACEAIRQDEVYGIKEFSRRTGLKDAALREARKRGLRVIYSGTRAFVRGADWFLFLDAEGAADEAS